MALTILQRPEGHILDTTVHTGTPSGPGDASFVSSSHGLSDGDYIYVVSAVEDYSGFFYVDVVDTNTFKLKIYSAGSFVQYISDATIEWYSVTTTHGWSCVHLPITYRISNNLFPVNSSDTSRNINSTTDINGWTSITISGSLGTIHSFDFVKLTVPNDTSLSGIYQIVEWISSTVVIINLAYDSSNNFTSATIIKHYNSYNTLVRVYAGINSSHQWTAQKPYELAATLKLTPDENNEVFFSINEILKSYVETRNNLLLGTLPNNIDFWTQFYIETAEGYDDSDGYSLGTYTGSYTSDQTNFEGVAVNAMLPFKNIHSGYLSDYLMTNTTAKFLTLFSLPVLFGCSDDNPNCYQDVSFLLPSGNPNVSFFSQYYYQGDLQTTQEDVIDNPIGGGVYRMPIDSNCSFDRVDIHLEAESETYPLLFTSASQEATADVNWIQDDILSTGGAIVYLTSGQNSEEIGFPLVIPGGTQITQTITRFSAGGSGTSTIYVRLYTTFSGGVFSGLVDEYSVTASSSTNISFVASETANYIVYYVDRAAGAGTYSFLVYSITLGVTGTISETKTFSIECGCSNQEIILTWLNNLGGFDYWNFTGKKDHIVEIQEALTTKKNIFPQWPQSYGSTADTIRKQTFRSSNSAYTVRAQHLTQSQADAIAYIKSSVLAQIINSRQDRRTVIVDTESFIKYQDHDKLYTIAFNISFTDNLPVQIV